MINTSLVLFGNQKRTVLSQDKPALNSNALKGQQADQVSLQFSGKTDAMKNTTTQEAAPLFGADEVKAPEKIRLADYKPYTHEVDKTDLTFELNDFDDVVVSSKLKVRPNPKSDESSTSMVLDGAPAVAPKGTEVPTMELLEVKVNGEAIPHDDYTREGDKLTLYSIPSGEFTLEIKTKINPEANKSNMGLYVSNGKFSTQCEADGFRNMTFYPDRPDVMSEYTTTIIADKGKFEQMLSNGNPGIKAETADGREQIVWHDPFKKPSYLFALVAGNLDSLEDTFTTMSGRKVDLVVYTDKGDGDKLDHAMASLKKSMKWDEEKYGREYDLDLFQIVAVNDFNMGAMENKGLNIFLSALVLADPETATDARYEAIEAVVGHEYFHNWTGNRITAQNWFQLTLKEGLTVFRDAEFTADMNSRAVKRIDDATDMRTRQFAEDASAMAHPIRPSEVVTMNNFYSSTVYTKGAEVIRMIHTLLGPEKYRKATDLYFDRHDGQAVTTEDFIKAMEDASGVDLTQFEATWYNQAGTPTLDFTDSYDPSTKEYKLTIKQSTPETPETKGPKKPFHIPVRVGLLDSNGNDMPLELDESQVDLLTNSDVLNLKENETTFVFKNVSEKPTPSLLRNWSAPVKMNYDYSRDDLTFLMANDNDGFNRWEAGQKLGVDVLKDLIEAQKQGSPIEVDSKLIDAFKAVLADKELDPALAAKALILPSDSYLAELYPDGQVDVDAIYQGRKQAREAIGKALEPMLLERFNNSRSTESRPYEWNVADAGERSIKKICLSYLMAADPQKYMPLAVNQYDLKHNITDVRSALRHIIDDADASTRQEILDKRYDAIKDNVLVVEQWLVDQAIADSPDVLDQVKALKNHEAYDDKNVSSIRSLVGAFTQNTVAFHKKDGSGYKFLADEVIRIDKFNPDFASGLAKKLSTPHKFDKERQELMKTELQRILQNVNSNNVKEVVSKSLELLAKKQAEQG